MTTLITDREAHTSQHQNLADKAMNLDSNGKVNSVISKLVLNWRKLMHTECNMNLFANLLKRNVSTRDIYDFVKKQSLLKKVYKGLDKPLTRAAMRGKLNDACAFAHRQRRVVIRLKQDLLRVVGNKKFKQKKILKQIKVKLDGERFTQSQKDKKKVERYVKLQSQMDTQKSQDSFQLPASISDFSALKAFNLPEKLIDENPSPMIYDDTIVLSENEKAILAKGPKFAVRQKILAESFKLELEKMICKQKYRDPDDLQLSPSLDKLEKSPTQQMSASFASTNQKSAPTICPQTKLFQHGNHQVSSKNNKREDFEEKRAEMVYDLEGKTLNPNRLRASNYRFNRAINLPKPQQAETEVKHEIRKVEATKAFDKLMANSTSKNSGFSLANKSNLSPEELDGLKSLQRRIANKEIVVCESDKSSKLCVLSQKQYIESGKQHCLKDIEISLTDVTRLQKYVNSHVDWLHDICGTGTFWGQEDRIKNSSMDLGSQAAPLRLLLKDHKSWDKNSGKPIPSRPVINGKGGYNSHLSEILSMILGPLSKEAMGSEINSTGDLLAKIQSVNESISENAHNPLNSSFSSDDDDFCDYCENCNSEPPTDKELKVASDFVASVASKKVKSAMNVSNNLRLKLRASRTATKLYHKCCRRASADQPIRIQDRPSRANQIQEKDDFERFSADDERSMGESEFKSSIGHYSKEIPDLANFSSNLSQNSNSELDINIENGLIITGFDVESMYPNLRDIDVACLVRETVLHSDINFEGFDYLKALCYLRIVAGPEILRAAGLAKHIPKWRGDKVDALRVTGTSGKKMEGWIHSPHYLSKVDERRILGLVLEVGILVAMGSHCYEFGGKFYLQTRGGGANWPCCYSLGRLNNHEML